MATEWDLQNLKWFLVWGTSTDMLGNGLMVLRVCMVGMELQTNVKGRRILKFCDEKKLCVANTWCEKEHRKITYSMGGNETEIDFVLIGKNNRKYDVKAIPGELLHRLVVTDIDKRKLKKVVNKELTIRRKVWKLKENNIKTKFKRRDYLNLRIFKDLVDIDAPNLWNTFKNSMLQACDKVCGKKKSRKKPWGNMVVE